MMAQYEVSFTYHSPACSRAKTEIISAESAVDAIGKFYNRHYGEGVHVENAFELSPTMIAIDELAIKLRSRCGSLFEVLSEIAGTSPRRRDLGHEIINVERGGR